VDIGAYEFSGEEENAAPVADAGQDVTVECASPAGTRVGLNGSGSYDPDEDEITYAWSVAAKSGLKLEAATTATPVGVFPLGCTRVTLVVSDGRGGTSMDDVLVTVVDTTPPDVSCGTDRKVLWPPNHQMVPVRIRVRAADLGTSAASLVARCGITSSEPDEGKGDGKTTGDVNGSDGYGTEVPVALAYDLKTGDFVATVRLRAERDGKNGGRVYAITCRVTDASGNTGTARCEVRVPKSKPRK
jgi:hypothetical protein